MPKGSFEFIAARELRLSRLLIAYIAVASSSCCFPGHFWEYGTCLQSVVTGQSRAVSPAWIQAHGHAQIFGWIGTFILGIGYYSVPKLRRMKAVCSVGALDFIADVGFGSDAALDCRSL